MQYLFESWCGANEQWNKSTVFMNLTSNSGSIRRGKKRWMTRKELAKLLGEEAADAVIQHKLSCQHLIDTETRYYPDAPNSEALLDSCFVPSFKFVVLQ